VACMRFMFGKTSLASSLQTVLKRSSSPVLQEDHLIPVRRVHTGRHQFLDGGQDLHQKVGEVDWCLEGVDVVLVVKVGHLTQYSCHHRYTAVLYNTRHRRTVTSVPSLTTD